MFDESVESWFGQFESGGVALYTSDGDASTIAVPDPLPAVLQGRLDEDMLTGAGKQVIQYDPATGQTLDVEMPVAVTRPREPITRRQFRAYTWFPIACRTYSPGCGCVRCLISFVRL